MEFDRDIFLTASDEELSSLCRITFTKATGPGGQKRNKTSSAVQIDLPVLGISVADCTERSQFRNRTNALKKLRFQIALQFRKKPMPPENMECSVNSPAYPLFVARLLDILYAGSFDQRKAADFCGISPTALLKKLYRDPKLWQFFTQQRNILQLPILHPPK